MNKRHVNVNFHYIRQGDLAPLATNIVNTMAANVDIFPTPVPSLASIRALIYAYAAVLGKPEYAWQTADIHAARMALEAGLKALGEYVNSIANGDVTILEKRDFEISKVPTSVGPLPAPDFLKVGRAEGGSFECKAALVKDYWGYLFAFTLQKARTLTIILPIGRAIGCLLRILLSEAAIQKVSHISLRLMRWRVARRFIG